MNSLTVIGGKVLIRLDDRPTQTETGLALPEYSREATTWGTVVATGPRVKELQPDNRVHVPRTLGHHFRRGGRDYIIVEENRLALMELPNG